MELGHFCLSLGRTLAFVALGGGRRDIFLPLGGGR